MSLLMQALKKAETAKQQQNDAPGSDAPPAKENSAAEGLSLSPLELTPSEPARPGLDLPLIIPADDPSQAAPAAQSAPLTAPVELPMQVFDEPSLAAPSATGEPEPVSAAVPLASTDVTVQAPAARREEPAAAAKMPAPPAGTTSASVPKSPPYSEKKSPAAQRAAQTVFASKQTPRQHRALRFAIFGALGVLALSAGLGYYFLQSLTQPSAVLVAAAPQPPVEAATPPDFAVQPTEAAPAEAAFASAGVMTAAGPDNTLPANLQAKPEQAITETPMIPASGTVTAAMPAQNTAAVKATNPASAELDGIKIRQTVNVDQVNPTLAGAYQAYLAGDTALAQQRYQQVLQQDATNRDALLGLAAIAVVRRQITQAVQHYLKLLEFDPADADAIAGLTSLQQGNLAQNESRLKKILADNPQAAAVQFVLGNLYAQQERWAEAQQAYFQAFGSAPGNADYAFNLAVSLDRLSQTRLALDYYQRALALAQNSPANFNQGAIQNRIRELQATSAS